MKTIVSSRIVPALFVVICSLPSTAQSPRTECDNYNAFLDSSGFATILAITDTVYSNGCMLFIPDSIENKSMQYIYELLEIEEDNSFDTIQVNQSRFDSTLYFVRFRQFYKEIEVDGGGVTFGYSVAGGPFDDDRCRRLQSLSPFVRSGLENLDTEPNLDNEAELCDILEVDSLFSMDLIISHNLKDSCEYKLTWQVSYLDTLFKRSWIDAHTGDVLRTLRGSMDKDAPTEDYGTVEVEDTDEGMITILTTDNLNSPNGTLTTYDCGQATLPQSPTSEVFQQSNIPTSPAGPDWNATHADPSVFQAHRITTDVLNHLSDMNINFNNIHVASNCSSFNARLVGTTVNDNGYIAIGQDLFGSTFAEADIITHELGHHLFRSNELLDYTERSAPLQEGISDMLAVYVESLEQFGVPDWIIGNRVSVNIRDLESPVFDCYDDVDDFTIDDRHLRGAPLGHWYYLVASGALGGDIVELGPLVPLEVALEALNHIDQDSDYPELMEGTIQVALERFGRCSDEFIAIANAWEEICVPTGLPTDENGLISCEYSFDLPAFVCEEDDYLKVCLDNPSTGHHYTWTIIGKNSPQYVMNGTQTGNSTTGQNLTCLEITSFPSLPYYPQSITIQVYSPNLGASFLVKRLTMIVDCEHDDPTCDEYYESQGYSYIPNAGSTSDLEIVPPRSMSRYSTTEPEVSKLVNVYNILGQIIFSGTSDDVNNFLLSYIGVHGSQILFKVTYQQNGEVVDTEKIVFLGR